MHRGARRPVGFGQVDMGGHPFRSRRDRGERPSARHSRTRRGRPRGDRRRVRPTRSHPRTTGSPAPEHGGRHAGPRPPPPEALPRGGGAPRAPVRRGRLRRFGRHVRQVPAVGSDWDAMPESYTTLAWLAALTTTVRLGTMVTAITYRNVAHLGKIVATLDVLSGGRAVCGLGAAWYEREHKAYGWA